MFDLNELEHFVAFSELGTLARVSERFHISAPTITRSMKHVEEGFGVALFTREKNKIELNDTGVKAVECAGRILDEVRGAVRDVRAFDMSLKTITVKSCAPAPLWKLLPTLSASTPGMTVSSSVCQNEDVVAALNDGSCDIAILPWDPEENVLCCSLTEDAMSRYSFSKYISEHLFICVRPDHELATRESVQLNDINGYNFLLRSELGFWDTLCRQNMPSSRFLVQTDEFEFYELVRNSSLPCFVTDYIQGSPADKAGRVRIPITDSCVNVTFYICVRKGMNIKF